LRLTLAEHPYVPILLDQNDLKLRIVRELNPIITMCSWHGLSLRRLNRESNPCCE
jgi:hypothetical protein